MRSQPPSTINYGLGAADLDMSPIDVPPVVNQIEITEDGTQVTTLPDGSVIIGETKEEKKDTSFSKNLADGLDRIKLDNISYDIIDGIANDIQSRSDMVDAYVKGIDLLGLKMKEGSGALNKKNTASITHPLLLESIVRFQSATRAELLPAEGPVKVAVDIDGTEQLNELADQLQQDMNHYLTTTATEYYPDTDRGLFRLGFGGTIFKKIYHCPIRKRPVSECVYLPDLIVSEDATDLDNAIRVTHQITMSPSMVKRMQASGAWVDVDLMTPTMSIDEVKDKVKSVEGIKSNTTRQQDQSYTIYECYCDLDIEDGDFPYPYRVTLEKDSQKILEIRRAWKEGDKDYKKNLPFVTYGLIPGMGFLSYGYLHLLGNQVKTLTAIWRLLIDAGMFSNFPGGVKIKGSRQTTNEINPGPGEWVEIDPPVTGVATDIRQLLMALPYKEPSAVFIQFAEMISGEVAKVSGATMMEVGEGRTNVPVGTIMAMIEQQTQIMAAVHKRLHSAQGQEFRKLRELFIENPEALWKSNPNPKRQWTAEEFTNLSLNPASDPNIPAQIHRIMQATALKTMAQQSPNLYNAIAVEKRVLKTIGVGDVDAILNENPQQQPNPAVLGKLADVQAKQQDLQLKQQEQQRQAAASVVEAQMKDKELQMEGQQREADRQSHEKVALIHLAEEKIKLQEKTNGSNGQNQI